MKSQSMNIFVKMLLLSSLVMLSSCSMLSPVKVDAKSTYLLNRVPVSVPKRATRPITLLVMTPVTRPTYNTTQMAYTVRPYEVAYFSKNQWSETPSQMLQPLIVQTMQKTRLFHAVVTPPYIGRYDYILNTEIEQLQQDFTVCPAQVRFKARVQLSRAATNQVMATREISVSQPIMQRSPYAGVFAANRAAAEVLEEMAEFCVRKITRSAR